MAVMIRRRTRCAVVTIMVLAAVVASSTLLVAVPVQLMLRLPGRAVLGPQHAAVVLVEGFSLSPSTTTTVAPGRRIRRRTFTAASSGSARSGGAGGRHQQQFPATTVPRKSPMVALSSSSSSSEDDEEERMEMVRQLQKTFYRPSAAAAALSVEGEIVEEEEGPYLDNSTGVLRNLPLWRVGWVEVPGRANCLNVHEGHYTNMFEKILARPDEKSWYFGHLHLPGGTKAARSGERRFELKTWEEEAGDANRFDESEIDRSAVVGCLLRITDYRRIKDGRLVILVHALERFVVDEVVQTFPHGVAHVQILPDADAVDGMIMPSSSTKDNNVMDENFAKSRRAAAVEASFRYHEYECDPIPLPLPKDTEYMSQSDIFGVEIAKCLPFAFYSKDDSKLPDITIQSDENDNFYSDTSFAGGQPPLEDLLQRDLILRNPPPVSGVKSRSEQDADTLETFLWLAVEEFCRSSGVKLPEEILCLVPPEMGSYLDLPAPKDGFRLSTKYPKSRRQWRLSYHVLALIENTPFGAAGMRQVWLNTPTTRARLAAALERFQAINESRTGQFQ